MNDNINDGTLAVQLEHSVLFKGVSLEDRAALIQLMRRQSYPAGAVLFEKGAPGDSMYIVLSGRVRIYTRDAEDRELTLRHLEDTVGEFSMLDGKPRSASAAAAEPLDVLILHRDDFLAFLHERPLVGLAMMRELVERVRYTTTYLENVLDATQQLERGNYEQALQQVPESALDGEIQGLLDAFLKMVHSVQAREATLKLDQRPASTDKNP
ncbi:MAG: cyclic nucleotide-binding domain-containing protein [Anaerolineae bacterium]|nr:cyclic nucleotide-binding domain-containing protein [Anaerolineae bacterium]